MKHPLQFQNHPVIELSDEKNQVLISPEQGARVLRWKVQGREVITWPEAADWTNLLKVRGGNPVLFPFIARHFVEGKNELWKDLHGTVRPMPQHGFCRDAKFAVVELPEDDANTVRMRMTDNATTRTFYPFAFQFDVVVRLLPESCLEIAFETTNPGPEPLPYYAGHHFYLALPHQDRKDWRLNLPCASWARQNPDGSIAHEEVGSELLRLDDPALVDRFQVKPLGSRLTLFHAKTNQRLIYELKVPNAVGWYAVTTWTQTPESNFYCLEPWLGLPNAIHHREGLRWVAPGTMERAACRLDAREW